MFSVVGQLGRVRPTPRRLLRLSDRFLDGSTAALPKLAYLPFGGGPHVCIGQHFATMEAELLLATLLQQVELNVLPDFVMELAPVITMRSRHGLPVSVRRRTRRNGKRSIGSCTVELGTIRTHVRNARLRLHAALGRA